MKRPAFQFYTADWMRNPKLRRCSREARGLWIDGLCLLHDADEYGLLRWPLADIANALGVPVKMLRELAEKDVLKGSDKFTDDYTHRPTHAGVLGAPVVLIKADGGPCWFSSRMVRDEWVRLRRGGDTRFGAGNTAGQPPPKVPPNLPPTARVGERQGEGLGDGPSSSSSSSELQNRDVGVTPTTVAPPLASVSGNGAVGKSATSKAKTNTAGQQWSKPAYVAATAKTLGLSRHQGESDGDFKDRVYAAVQQRMSAVH